MSAAIRIAREEWRALLRNRAGVIAAVLLVALVLVASAVSLDRRARTEADRLRYQSGMDAAFDAQPDRHPHRMVHYGQFVFRPIAPLAFFDAGINGHAGTTVFLEGHRQNSANFAEVRQSSLLLRFGQLTPAFVLQTLAPLLLIFLGFTSIARERERGTLRVLLAQGTSRWAVLGGKLLGHGSIALAVGAPAFVVLAGFALMGAAGWGAIGLLIVGYAAWLLLWAGLTVLVSAWTARPRDALALLTGLWMVGVILLPRVLPEVAGARAVLPTRIETDIALHRDLAAIGDSHDPDDPYFAEFRRRALARYGVLRVEDLPVQYAGLVGIEGERLTTALHARAAAAVTARATAQGRFVHAFAILSPVIAIRQLSMALSGSDPAAHRDFLDQAEAFRYRFVQQLNRMQAELIPHVGGDDPRISATNWRKVPRFAYRPPAPPGLRDAAVVQNLAMLFGWLAALGLLAVVTARRLGRIA